MARFKYMGEPSRPGLVQSYGNCFQIRLNCTDVYCETTICNPIDPNTYFTINQDMGIEITCEHCLKVLRADSRFQEII